MSWFWSGFLLAFLILAPVRLMLGYYQVAVWDKDGFRWVLKWNPFDRWEKFFCLKPRFVSGKIRWLTHLERKYVDCIGAYDNDGNGRLSFVCEVEAGYVYRLPGGVTRMPIRWFCCGCGFLSHECECDGRVKCTAPTEGEA